MEAWVKVYAVELSEAEGVKICFAVAVIGLGHGLDMGGKGGQSVGDGLGACVAMKEYEAEQTWGKYVLTSQVQTPEAHQRQVPHKL